MMSCRIDILLKLFLTLGLTMSLSVTGFSQSAKKLVKTADKLYEAKQYQEACENYTKAKAADPQRYDAYFGMGRALYKMGRQQEAFNEFERASAFDEKASEPWYYMGVIHSEREEWEKAANRLRVAADRDRKNEKTLRALVHAELNLPDFEAALQSADKLNKADDSAYNIYLKGVVLDSLRRYPEAEERYKKARFSDPKLAEAYLGSAHARFKQGQLQQALEDCNKVLEKDRGSVEGYMLRSKIHREMKDYSSAINDLSAVLEQDPKNERARLMRAKTYATFGQPQNAISDWSFLLRDNPDHIAALHQRARAYESIDEYQSAIRDYERLRRLSPYDERAAELLEASKKQMFELNRESDLPELTLNSYVVNDKGQVEIPGNLATANFEGHIEDASPISSMTINNEKVLVPSDSINPRFEYAIKLDGLSEVVFRIEDIYGNQNQILYKIRRTEVNPPKIQLLAPYAGDDGTISIAGNIYDINIEGVVRDESPISKITVNDVNASFMTGQLNPKFTASLRIANKSHIVVEAEDVFGNQSEVKLEIDRSGTTLSADNPMGKTWVVFIENSNYSSFASIDGPAKDVNIMKQAFAGYHIHNVIHKKDMSKTEMERFFSIDLRDLVRSNEVNSLLVWFAGHGKYINNTGYWIPVDASRDDEFSYFNINTLKAGMMSYSDLVTHTLVVTDACESGPSFADVTREKLVVKRCDDWEAARLKSSQVFSSAGYELASDNSQFTRTFANMLSSNPDACMPIESVVIKVSEVVKGQGHQTPKFGAIDGLAHENGTFFFMRKTN